MPRNLDYAFYADKPKRRLSGTDVTAVTLYRSGDNSVREYDLFTDDDAYLGRCYYHPRRIARAAGYTMKPVYRVTDEWWPNLWAFAAEMKRRHGIETQEVK